MEQNTERFDVFLAGKLVTASPLTYTIPDCNGLPRIGGKLYIPGVAIRGALRRAARDHVLEYIRRHTDAAAKLSFEDFYFLTLGGIKNPGKKDGSEESLESKAIHAVQFAEQNNPLISLFGAMAPVSIASKLQVEPALAISNGVEVAEVRPDIIRHTRTDDAQVRAQTIAELIDTASFLDAYRQYKEGLRKSQEAKKANRAPKDKETQDGNDTKKAPEGKKVQTHTSIAQPDLVYEVIPPGTEFALRMRMMRASRAEISLFMNALNRFSFNPLLGGRRQQGNGLLSGQITASARRAGQMVKPQRIGALSWDADFAGLQYEQVGAWGEIGASFEDILQGVIQDDLGAYGINALLAAIAGSKNAKQEEEAA